MTNHQEIKKRQLLSRLYLLLSLLSILSLIIDILAIPTILTILVAVIILHQEKLVRFRKVAPIFILFGSTLILMLVVASQHPPVSFINAAMQVMRPFTLSSHQAIANFIFSIVIGLPAFILRLVGTVFGFIDYYRLQKSLSTQNYTLPPLLIGQSQQRPSSSRER